MLETPANKSHIEFELPSHLACPKPTELRNVNRDAVRLLVTTGSEQIKHDIFTHVDRHLLAGDVLVVNTSATVPSALPVTFPDATAGMLHLSNKLNKHEWLIELREIRKNKTVRWKGGKPGMVFPLPEGASIVLKRQFYKDGRDSPNILDLWVAEFVSDQDVPTYLGKYADPIKYEGLNNPYPLSYYQTFFSFEKGSAEMPSAGRGFTGSLVRKLIKRGVVFAPILLHTGVSSLEEGEKPYPEYMEISPVSALLINEAKAEGRRVIAVGTTAIRAIESAVNEAGVVETFRGNTDLFVHDAFRLKVTDGLLTGFHEPRASHLNMLHALAGAAHIERAYQEAIASNYYWHQFGDLHLILP